MTLRSRLQKKEILIAPGVYDGLTAILAEKAGFEALYLGGAAVSYTRLGRPDIGLSTASEMVDTMALIADRSLLPVIIDADTGFGNALNAQRTMRLYERAGASALQLEDQTYPKRCGHLSDKSLISKQEMIGKVAAMSDARASDETLIIARTDAVAVEGFNAAIDRAGAYLEAGADVLFIEAPISEQQLYQIMNEFGSRVPLLVNMVEGGATPISSAQHLEELGFSIVIFPGGIVRAIARTAQTYYASLYENGSNKKFSNKMFDFIGLNNILDTKAMLSTGAKYDPRSE